jgi:hypothetical protein
MTPACRLLQQQNYHNKIPEKRFHVTISDVMRMRLQPEY